MRLYGKHRGTLIYSMWGRKKSETVMGQALVPVLPNLWRFALSLSGRPDVADDLVQSTCLRAIERQDQFQPGTKLQAWVFTICRSIWLNELRKTSVRKTGSLTTVAVENIPDIFPPQETNIFAREVFMKVMALPEAQRETVLLVYVEEFTYREAADLLDVPIGTIMSRLSAARAKLAPLAQSSQGTGKVQKQ
ncbi:MAG: RNA polymerase sigma factor [Pseudomonadota bacterium]